MRENISTLTEKESILSLVALELLIWGARPKRRGAWRPVSIYPKNPPLYLQRPPSVVQEQRFDSTHPRNLRTGVFVLGPDKLKANEIQ